MREHVMSEVCLYMQSVHLYSLFVFGAVFSGVSQVTCVCLGFALIPCHVIG